MVIPFYCEDYPEDVQDLNDVESSPPTTDDAKSPNAASNEAKTPQPPKPKRPFWRKKRFQIPFFLFAVCPLLLALAAKLLYSQSVPLKPSPETTGFVEPLTPDGNVDFRRIYEERQDAWLAPPEENGFREILQAFGPVALEQLYIAQTVRWEDFPTDKASSDWFANDWTRLCRKFKLDPTARPPFLTRLSLIDYLRLNGVDGTEPLPTETNDAPSVSQDAETVYVDAEPRPARVSADAAQRCFDALQKRPWTAEEFPVAARWIEENADRYAVYESALNRPKYGSWRFVDGETLDDWFNIQLPDVIHNHKIAKLLAIRANYRIGCGDVDGALDDWALLLRMSRHILDNPNNLLVESITGLAYYGRAASIEINANPNAQPTAEQWARAAKIYRETFGEYDFDAVSRRTLDGDSFFSVAFAHAALVYGFDKEDASNDLATLKRMSIDANVAMKTFNEALRQNRFRSSSKPRVRNASSLENKLSCKKRSQHIGNILADLILFPAHDETKKEFYRADNSSRLQTLQIATLRYQAERGTLPPAFTVDAQKRPLHSWRVLILPYLNDECKALYEQIRLDEPWDSPHNRQFAEQMPDVFRRPEDAPDSNLAAYSVIVGPNSLYNESGVGVDLAERIAAPERVATSQALIVERKTPVVWMQPDAEILESTAFEDGIDGSARELPGPANPNGIGPRRGGGSCVATANGAVRFFANEETARWKTRSRQNTESNENDSKQATTLDELILGVKPF